MRLLPQLMLWMFLYVASPAMAAVIYVDAAVATSGDGTSWQTAKKTIGEGVAAASSGTEVWVARGVYHENVIMKREVSLIGSFDYEDLTLADRDFSANRSFIQGDRTTCTVRMENLWDAELDGFDLTGGQKQYGSNLYAHNNYSGCAVRNCRFSGANSVRPDDRHGAYVNGQMLIENCEFTNNDGHGLFAWGMTGDIVNCDFTLNDETGLDLYKSTVKVANSRIVSNGSTYSGAGAQVHWSDVTFDSCEIVQNVSTEYGGAMSVYRGSATLKNCLLARNQAVSGGAIWCATSASINLTHCTLDGNVSTDGKQIYGMTGSSYLVGQGYTYYPVFIVLRNSIFSNWGSGDALCLSDTRSTMTPTHCLFNGTGSLYVIEEDPGAVNLTSAEEVNAQVASAAGNVAGDPLFLDPQLRNYRLRAGSPAIDSAPSRGLAWDADKKTRPVEIADAGDDSGTLAYDIGRYERRPVVISPAAGEECHSNIRMEWLPEMIPGDHVKLLLFRNGKWLCEIAATQGNDGEHEWKIPTSITPGGNYQVCVRSKKIPTIQEFSAPFVIPAPASARNWSRYE